MSKKLVLLNGFPLNIIGDLEEATIYVRKVTIEELKEKIKKYDVIENYIRHPATVQFLSRELGIDLKPCDKVFVDDKKSTIIMIGLKNPQRGKEVTDVTADDLLIYMLCLLIDGYRIWG